jgi:hypothetical protein
VSAAYGDAAAKKGPVERPGGGGGDGPSGPPRVINPPPSGGDKPIIPNLKEGFTQHNINNQKLKNAVALGLISNDEYNILGGYDVNQTMGLNPFMTGMTSGLYNVYQTIKGDQPASEIYGDVKRNVQGSFGLPEDLQAKYDNIMSMSSDELTNQLADLNLANQRTAQMAGGGMPYEGGIMDLESARQMYGLGKLVKKVTRGIKKIVKSPIGKAAIIGGLTFGIPGVQSGFFSKGLMGTQKGLGLRKFLTDSIFGKVTDLGIAGPNRAARTGGLLNFLKDNPLMAIGGASALAGLYTAKTEDEEPLYAGADIDDPRKIMANPYKYLNIRNMAEGGSTEKEPVAKKTMPLLDMGGMEKDYREEGGFVPIGRMEKADDVPARLSKNEFVFTADAVRNAGDGDVDLGAEKMYNMMKNLEAGGDVSEESQGLEGAREMFQTSKRLEEVL